MMNLDTLLTLENPDFDRLPSSIDPFVVNYFSNIQRVQTQKYQAGVNSLQVVSPKMKIPPTNKGDSDLELRLGLETEIDDSLEKKGQSFYLRASKRVEDAYFSGIVSQSQGIVSMLYALNRYQTLGLMHCCTFDKDWAFKAMLNGRTNKNVYYNLTANIRDSQKDAKITLASVSDNKNSLIKETFGEATINDRSDTSLALGFSTRQILDTAEMAIRLESGLGCNTLGLTLNFDSYSTHFSSKFDQKNNLKGVNSSLFTNIKITRRILAEVGLTYLINSDSQNAFSVFCLLGDKSNLQFCSRLHHQLKPLI